MKTKQKKTLINTLCNNNEGGGLESLDTQIIDGFYLSIFMIFKTGKHEPE